MALHIRRTKQIVLVRDGRQRSRGRLVLTTAKIHVINNRTTQTAVVVAENGLDRGVLERRALDQELGVRARVDTGVEQVGEEAAIVFLVRMNVLI